MYREREILALVEYEEALMIPQHIREQRFEARVQERPKGNGASNGHFRVSLKELLKPGMFEELCRRFQ